MLALGALSIGTAGLSNAAFALGAATILEIIVGVTAIVAAIGGIAQIPGLDWLLEEGIAFLKKLAQGLGEIIGVFIGSIAGMAFEKMGESMKNMSNGMSVEDIQKAGLLMGALKDMTSAIGDAAWSAVLIKFFGVDYSTIGVAMGDLGKGVMAFQTVTKNILPESIANAVEALKPLLELVTNNTEEACKLSGWFKAYFEGIEAGMLNLGKGLAGFTTPLKGLDFSNNNAACDSAVYITNTITQIKDAKTTDKFDFIPKLGDAISDYSKKVSGVDNSKIVQTADGIRYTQTQIGTLSFTGSEKLKPLGPYSTSVWAVIWANLAYNSIITRWYMLSVPPGEVYEKNDLIFMLGDDYSQSTRDNAVTALLETFRHSPIGSVLKQGIPVQVSGSWRFAKDGWETPEAAAILYSLYLYAEKTGRYTFSLKQLEEAKNSPEALGIDPVSVFGLKFGRIKGILQEIALHCKEYIRVSFVKDLDTVHLTQDIKSIDIVSLFQ
jgi:hypothetical protein